MNRCSAVGIQAIAMDLVTNEALRIAFECICTNIIPKNIKNTF